MKDNNLKQIVSICIHSIIAILSFAIGLFSFIASIFNNPPSPLLLFCEAILFLLGVVSFFIIAETVDTMHHHRKTKEKKEQLSLSKIEVAPYCRNDISTDLGHDLVHHEAKAATCTEHGHNAYDTCKRCDYTTYEEIAAKGHQCGEWHETQAATCTEGGVETRECANCDYFETRETEALGHDLVHHEAKDATKTTIKSLRLKKSTRKISKRVNDVNTEPVYYDIPEEPEEISSEIPYEEYLSFLSKSNSSEIEIKDYSRFCKFYGVEDLHSCKNLNPIRQDKFDKHSLKDEESSFDNDNEEWGGFRSSWEANIAKILSFKNLKYEYEERPFTLINGNVSINYLPDFFIDDANTIIEVKGFWDMGSYMKVSMFIRSNPNQKLLVVDEDMYYDIQNVYTKYHPLEGWFFQKKPKQARTHFVTVVGLSFYNSLNEIKKLSIGQSLQMELDCKNPFDQYAVAVKTMDGKMIGHLSRFHAVVVHQKMSLGMRYKMRIIRITNSQPYWLECKIERINTEKTIIHDILMP